MGLTIRRRWNAFWWAFGTRWRKGWRRGRCAGCGEMTTEWDWTFAWFICNTRRECTSHYVSDAIAEHVMFPNGREDDAV